MKKRWKDRPRRNNKIINPLKKSSIEHNLNYLRKSRIDKPWSLKISFSSFNICSNSS